MANAHDERGFNTVGSDAMARRQKKQTMQTYTLFGVIALFVLMVAVLLVLAVGAIISNLRGANSGKPGILGDGIEWGSITVATSDTQSGDLVLVNDSHKYTFPETTDHLDEIYAAWAKHATKPYVLSGLSKYMDRDALAALDAMLADFAESSGKTNVQIRYAYRTAEEQESFSVRPGYSDHHTGLGCELKYSVKNAGSSASYDLSNDPAYAWITENCHKYGFIVRYPADKVELTEIEDYESYFRYVGVAHATYMKDKGLCLEEYIEALHGYTAKKPLEIRGADGKTYEVYYVAVDGSATVSYPTNYAYSISGTNEGGVVVTVDRSAPIQPTESGTGDAASTGEAGTSGNEN